MRNIILTQSQLDKIVRNISEQWDEEDPYEGSSEDYHRWRDSDDRLSNVYELLGGDDDELLYSQVDFVDLFINNFKKWMVEKHGPDSLDYPIRFLLYHNMSDFLLHLGWEQPKMRLWTLRDVERFLQGDGYPSVEEVVGKAIKDGKFVRYKSVKPQQKILHKYKRLIDGIISEWELPPWANIIVEEEEPHKFVVDAVVDLEEALKDPKIYDREISASNAARILQNQLKNFGLKIGDRFLGQIRIEDGTNYFKETTWDEWLKNVWQKEIVPGIKKLDTKKLIRSIQLERFVSPMKEIVFKLVMKNVNSMSKENREYSRQLTKTAKKYVQSLGYPKIVFDTNA